MQRWLRLSFALVLALAPVGLVACGLTPTDPIPQPEPEPPPEPPVDPPPEPPVDPPAPAPSDTIAAMTFNIFHDGVNELHRIAPWEIRRDFVVRSIADAGADIVGLQEAYMWQVAWLQAQLPHYDYVGRGKESDGTGESVSILFDTRRFELEESGGFWLSPTPDVPGSSGGDSWGGMRIARMVSWARLGYIDNDRAVYVYNVHLPANENGGAEARQRGVMLLADRIATRSKPQAPFILLGDLNAREDEFPIRYLQGRASAPGGGPSPVTVVDSWRQLNTGAQGTRCRNDAIGSPILHGDRVDYVMVMDTTWSVDSVATRSTSDGILTSMSVTPRPSCGSDHVGVMSRLVVP
jgi:endonuclease/exonuclease/phosphatase family metal-dependent hydrolase